MKHQIEPPNRSKRRFAALARGVLWMIVGMTVLRVWFGTSPALPSAQAQIPDPAKQRLTLLKETKRTNQLLAEIKAILQGGTLNVRIAGADN